MNRPDMPRFANLRSQAEIDAADRRDARTTMFAHILIGIGIFLMCALSLGIVYGALNDEIADMLPLGNLQP